MKIARKMLFLAVCLLLCVAMSYVGAAEEAALSDVVDDGEKTIAVTNKIGKIALSPSHGKACFWEYPTLTAGQNRTDGELWFDNQTRRKITVSLGDFVLPTDSATTAYLSALHLTVSNGETLLYSGPYADIGDTVLPLSLEKEEKKALYFSLACDFAYEGECEPSAVLYGEYSVDVESVPIWLIVLAAVAAFGFGVGAVVLVARKK